MLEDLTSVYEKKSKGKVHDESQISLFTLQGKLIENFYEVNQLNPWAMIVSFKGYVNGLKDSSVPMSEQENKQMALKWAKENMEKLKEKWNTIIKEGRHVWTIMLKS